MLISEILELEVGQTIYSDRGVKGHFRPYLISKVWDQSAEVTDPFVSLEEDGNVSFADLQSGRWRVKQPPTDGRPAKPMVGYFDVINKPKHYFYFVEDADEEFETITIIAASLTKAEFKAFCFGCMLKYRLRAGRKDDAAQDLGKADAFEQLYLKHKHLCREDSIL